MRKLATWQNGENKKPNQEPDSDFQFQLMPGTAVRLEPSPSGLPRLINSPSRRQRDPLTLTKTDRDWPTPSLWKLIDFTFLPLIDLLNLIWEIITFYETIYLHIKKAYFTILMSLTLWISQNIHKEKKILLPYCCAQLRWCDNLFDLLSPHYTF